MSFSDLHRVLSTFLSCWWIKWTLWEKYFQYWQRETTSCRLWLLTKLYYIILFTGLHYIAKLNTFSGWVKLNCVISHSWQFAMWAAIQALQAVYEAVTTKTKTKDHWPWRMSTGAEFHWSGFVTFFLLCHGSSVIIHVSPKKSYGSGRRSVGLLVLHNLQLQCRCANTLVYIMQKFHSYQHCISAYVRRRKDIGHFQSITPLWVSRLQVITANCWICCWGEHYNHVFPDKVVLKTNKKVSRTPPRLFSARGLWLNWSLCKCFFFNMSYFHKDSETKRCSGSLSILRWRDRSWVIPISADVYCFAARALHKRQ